MINCSRGKPKFHAIMEVRAAKYGATSVLMADSNLVTSKIVVTSVSSKLNEVPILAQKTGYLVRALF